MNITVINGTEKHGVTYRLKEMFLEEFKDKANITEYYLPKDCPNFCVGCLKLHGDLLLNKKILSVFSAAQMEPCAFL